MKKEEKIRKPEVRRTKHEAGNSEIKAGTQWRETGCNEFENSTVQNNKQLGLTAHTAHYVIDELAIMAC